MSPGKLSESDLYPYLNLRQKLSRIWLSYYVVFMLFFIYQITLHHSQISSKVDHAQQLLVSKCEGIESLGNGLLSIPQTTAQSINKATTIAINHSVAMAKKSLLAAIKAFRTVIVFLIETLKGTLLCLIETLLQGAFGLIEFTMEKAEKVIQELKNTLNNFIRTINQAEPIEEFTQNVANTFTALFGTSPVKVDFDIPEVTIDLNFLDFVRNAIADIKSKTPSFDLLRDLAANLVSGPFESLEKETEKMFDGIKPFEVELIGPVETPTVTICDNPELKLMQDEMNAVIRMWYWIVLGIVLFAIAIVIASEGIATRLEHFMQMKKLNRIHSHSIGESTVELWTAAVQPLFWTATIKFAKRFSRSKERQKAVRWGMHYACHAPSLICILAGLFYIISAIAQCQLMDRIAEKGSQRMQELYTKWQQEVMVNVKDNFVKSADKVASDSNGAIDHFESDINTVLTGWVQPLSNVVDESLKVFDSVDQETKNAFTSIGIPQLHQPLIGLASCIIQKRLEKLKMALEWIKENIKMSFPRIPPIAPELEYLNAKFDREKSKIVGTQENQFKDGALARMAESYRQGIMVQLPFFIFLLVSGSIIPCTGITKGWILFKRQ